MKIAIMQAYFFPYIGYFQLINSAEVFVIYEYVSFRKGSWVTRNRILDKGKNEPTYINLSVSKKSIGDIASTVILTHKKERVKAIANLVYYNYKKAPFFDEIYPGLKDSLFCEEQNLHSYNAKTIEYVCKLLGIETKIIAVNTDCAVIEDTLEANAKESGNNAMTQRVIELCKHYGGNHYINPIGGLELYSKEDFQKSDLEISFVKTDPIVYEQFKSPFVPGLSIIDVLMHNGIDETRNLLDSYQLV